MNSDDDSSLSFMCVQGTNGILEILDDSTDGHSGVLDEVLGKTTSAIDVQNSSDDNVTTIYLTSDADEQFQVFQEQRVESKTHCASSLCTASGFSSFDDGDSLKSSDVSSLYKVDSGDCNEALLVLGLGEVCHDDPKVTVSTSQSEVCVENSDSQDVCALTQVHLQKSEIIEVLHGRRSISIKENNLSSSTLKETESKNCNTSSDKIDLLELKHLSSSFEKLKHSIMDGEKTTVTDARNSAVTETNSCEVDVSSLQEPDLGNITVPTENSNAGNGNDLHGVALQDDGFDVEKISFHQENIEQCREITETQTDESNLDVDMICEEHPNNANPSVSQEAGQMVKDREYIVVGGNRVTGDTSGDKCPSKESGSSQEMDRNDFAQDSGTVTHTNIFPFDQQEFSVSNKLDKNPCDHQDSGPLLSYSSMKASIVHGEEIENLGKQREIDTANYRQVADGEHHDDNTEHVNICILSSKKVKDDVDLACLGNYQGDTNGNETKCQQMNSALIDECSYDLQNDTKKVSNIENDREKDSLQQKNIVEPFDNQQDLYKSTSDLQQPPGAWSNADRISGYEKSSDPSSAEQHCSIKDTEFKLKGLLTGSGNTTSAEISHMTQSDTDREPFSEKRCKADNGSCNNEGIADQQVNLGSNMEDAGQTSNVQNTGQRNANNGEKSLGMKEVVNRPNYAKETDCRMFDNDSEKSSDSHETKGENSSVIGVFHNKEINVQSETHSVTSDIHNLQGDEEEEHVKQIQVLNSQDQSVARKMDIAGVLDQSSAHTASIGKSNSCFSDTIEKSTTDQGCMKDVQNSLCTSDVECNANSTGSKTYEGVSSGGVNLITEEDEYFTKKESNTAASINEIERTSRQEKGEDLEEENSISFDDSGHKVLKCNVSGMQQLLEDGLNNPTDSSLQQDNAEVQNLKIEGNAEHDANIAEEYSGLYQNTENNDTDGCIIPIVTSVCSIDVERHCNMGAEILLGEEQLSLNEYMQSNKRKRSSDSIADFNEEQVLCKLIKMEEKSSDTSKSFVGCDSVEMKKKVTADGGSACPSSDTALSNATDNIKDTTDLENSEDASDTGKVIDPEISLVKLFEGTVCEETPVSSISHETVEDLIGMLEDSPGKSSPVTDIQIVQESNENKPIESGRTKVDKHQRIVARKSTTQQALGLNHKSCEPNRDTGKAVDPEISLVKLFEGTVCEETPVTTMSPETVEDLIGMLEDSPGKSSPVTDIQSIQGSDDSKATESGKMKISEKHQRIVARKSTARQALGLNHKSREQNRLKIDMKLPSKSPRITPGSLVTLLPAVKALTELKNQKFVDKSGFVATRVPQKMRTAAEKELQKAERWQRYIKRTLEDFRGLKGRKARKDAKMKMIPLNKLQVSLVRLEDMDSPKPPSSERKKKRHQKVEPESCVDVKKKKAVEAKSQGIRKATENQQVTEEESGELGNEEEESSLEKTPITKLHEARASLQKSLLALQNSKTREVEKVPSIQNSSKTARHMKHHAKGAMQNSTSEKRKVSKETKVSRASKKAPVTALQKNKAGSEKTPKILPRKPQGGAVDANASPFTLNFKDSLNEDVSKTYPSRSQVTQVRTGKSLAKETRLSKRHSNTTFHVTSTNMDNSTDSSIMQDIEMDMHNGDEVPTKTLMKKQVSPTKLHTTTHTSLERSMNSSSATNDNERIIWKGDEVHINKKTTRSHVSRTSVQKSPDLLGLQDGSEMNEVYNKTTSKKKQFPTRSHITRSSLEGPKSIHAISHRKDIVERPDEEAAHKTSGRMHMSRVGFRSSTNKTLLSSESSIDFLNAGSTSNEVSKSSRKRSFPKDQMGKASSKNHSTSLDDKIDKSMSENTNAKPTISSPLSRLSTHGKKKKKVNKDDLLRKSPASLEESSSEWDDSCIGISGVSRGEKKKHEFSERGSGDTVTSKRSQRGVGNLHWNVGLIDNEMEEAHDLGTSACKGSPVLPEFTYKDLKRNVFQVKLPNTLWATQVETNGRFVSFCRMSSNSDKNHVSMDKAVLFMGSCEPAVFFHEKRVFLPVDLEDLQSVEAVSDFLLRVHRVAFCKGTGLEEIPFAGDCWGFVDVTNTEALRCSLCTAVRKRTLLMSEMSECARPQIIDKKLNRIL